MLRLYFHVLATAVTTVLALTSCKRELLSKIASESRYAAEGRSLWDEVVAEFPEGKPPFPYEDLLSAVQSKLVVMNRDDGKPEPRSSRFLVPVSRSLPRGFSTWDDPRVIFGVTGDGQVRTTDGTTASHDDTWIELKSGRKAASGRLFLGYIKAHNQVEIISWNETQGRFEFQLIEDYKSDGGRNVRTAERGVCVTCHRGETPIFSNRQWDETNRFDNGATVWKRLCERHGKAEECRLAMDQDKPAPLYQGVPLVVRTDEVNRFHTAVETAARLVKLQRVWKLAWGETESCKKEIIVIGLALAKNADTVPDLSAACAAPVPNFTTPYELLSPMNPFDIAIAAAFPKDSKGWPLSPVEFTGALEAYNPSRNSNSPKITGSEIANALARFLVANDISGRLRVLEPEKLKTRLAAGGGEVELLLKRETLRGDAFITALTSAYNSTGTATTGGAASNATATASGSKTASACANLASSTVGSPDRRLMFHYCSTCHKSGSHDFMNEARSDDAFASNLRTRYGMRVIERLSSTNIEFAMPPAGSNNATCLEQNAADKEKILAFVRGIVSPSANPSRADIQPLAVELEETGE